MKSVATPGRDGEPGRLADIAATRRSGHRDTLEALSLLLGVLGILVGLAVTVGATLPIGP